MPHIGNRQDGEQRNDRRDGQRDQRHPPFVQAAERLRQLTVASHHVLNAHQTGDGCVDGRQQQQRENHGGNRREGRPDVVVGDDAQHVLFVSGVRIDSAFAQYRQRDRQHRQREDEVQHDDLDQHDPDGAPRRPFDRFHHDARHVGHGLDPRDGEDDRGELRPPLNR